MPKVWSWIGLTSIVIVISRLFQLYLSSLTEVKVITPGDNLWLLSIIRDFADFDNSQNSHAISGIGYSYHYGAIIHISVIARLHECFYEFGLLFMMPLLLYLFSILQILKITSLITFNYRSHILALVFFTFIPISTFSGSIREIAQAAISEPTFRFSYYLPTYYGFAVILFLTLITAQSNLSSVLFLCPILLVSIYSTKPAFLTFAMPLVFFLMIGRLNRSQWKAPKRIFFLAVFCSELVMMILLLPNTSLSSPYFDIHLDLQSLMENPIRAQNQSIFGFFLALAFCAWRIRKRLNYFQLNVLVSLILASFTAFISTSVIVLTYSERLPSEVLTNIQSNSDSSSFLSNDAQVLYSVVILFTILIPFLTWYKEKDFAYRTISTFTSLGILTLPIVQVSNEVVIYVREGRFLYEDQYDYGPYVNELNKVEIPNSLILPNDLASPFKEFSKPLSADYLSAFTNHSFYVSRLGWQSFSSEAWERIEKARKFFTTTDLNYVQNFIQQHNISHIAIHSRCSAIGSSSQDVGSWKFLSPEQLQLSIVTHGLPINLVEPLYGYAKCI
jgi:hypothetical protein